MSVDQSDWKSRAEWMLSQFIAGGNNNIMTDVDRFHSPSNAYYIPSSLLLDNYSTSDTVPDDTSYACVTTNCRFPRWFCVEGGEQCAGIESPCASLILHWMKLVIGGMLKAYLSNPLCLAFVPLVLGATIGFWAGRQAGGGNRNATYLSSENEILGTKKQITIDTSWKKEVIVRLTQLYQYLIIPVFIGMVRLDPRRRWSKHTISDSDSLFQNDRDELIRKELRTTVGNDRESGIEPQLIPHHIAVIMDGNRRYGQIKYGNATRGHWDGSKTLIEFSKWCISEGVKILTVYAFSTENWDRDASEVASLMSIFCKYCDELRLEAIQQGIQIRVLTTDETKIPNDVKDGMNRMMSETKNCSKFIMNICLSYGRRGEIINACKSIVQDVQQGNASIEDVNECMLQSKMLTGHCCDPDIVVRTSGEERLSNFLLWQVAYSEFFFLKKHWPEIEKKDLLEVIQTYARGRRRRFGNSTVEKVQEKWASMVLALNRIIQKWERSGQGYGGQVEEKDNEEDNEGNEGQNTSAGSDDEVAFGVLAGRSQGALDLRQNFIDGKCSYLLYLWDMLDEHNLFQSSMQRLSDGIGSGNGGKGVPSVIAGRKRCHDDDEDDNEDGSLSSKKSEKGSAAFMKKLDVMMEKHGESLVTVARIEAEERKVAAQHAVIDQRTAADRLSVEQRAAAIRQRINHLKDKHYDIVLRSVSSEVMSSQLASDTLKGLIAKIESEIADQEHQLSQIESTPLKSNVSPRSYTMSNNNY